MPDTDSFDLIRSPWLPVRNLDGSRAEHGVLGVLEHAHEMAGLSGDLPTQTAALTRMLLAVLHGALGPADTASWETLWRAERLPADEIAAYLERYAERFDLFGPTPFLQVADLRTRKGEWSELSKLVADVPNGVPVFTTRFTDDLSLSYAEAARWVVHCQAFDPSGIKSGAEGDNERVKGGRGYPIGVAWTGQIGVVLLEGATLKETLLLNLVPRDHRRFGREPAVDRPTWERALLTSAPEQVDGRRATGPVDLYTWPSRRIRLLPDGGRVTRVLIANGEKILPQDRFDQDPHTGWRRSENQERKLATRPVYMPRTHDPNRAIWRGLQSLLPAAPDPAGPTAGYRSSYPPGILDWLAELTMDHDLLPDDHLVRVRTIGMVYQPDDTKSVVSDVVNDALPLQAVLARRDAGRLAVVASTCVRNAEDAVSSVSALAANLAVAAGGEPDGPRSRTREATFARLDAPFRAWLSRLGPDSSDVEATTVWHRTVRSIVVDTARELLRDLPPGCWAEHHDGRGNVVTAAHADARFWKALRAAVPQAFLDDPDTSDEPADDAA